MKKLLVFTAVIGLLTVVSKGQPVFGLKDVVAKAEALSHQPFVPQMQDLSSDLKNLDYDGYRRIRFLTERTVWPEAPYRLGFFHPGFTYVRPRVLLHAIEPNRLRDIPFSPSYFFYDKELAFSGHESFAGFRAYVPSDDDKSQNEFLTLQGGCYFRAVSKKTSWGLSAKGLAINTGLAIPEEFPDFREFWIRKPSSSDVVMKIFALLDSDSVTGGYEFDVQYGEPTIMDVKATLFFRKKPDLVQLAPFSSMFYYGSNTVNKPTLKIDYQPNGKTEFSMNKTDFHRREFRPQVHDSDGVYMTTPSGERLWAPLDNPRTSTTRTFSDVTSFGLLQRDRNINDYLDNEAHYDLRPSTLVIPKSGFDQGVVRLFEFPITDETSDNVVLGWQPKNMPGVGTKWDFAYQIRWSAQEPNQDQFRVVSTTVRPNPGSGTTHFTVEYVRPDAGDAVPVAELRPLVTATQNGQVKELKFQPTMNGWLVSFDIYNPNPSQSLDLSCVILRGDKFYSEKWLYLLST
jgi:periplasmic glucans biosynthesis protein